MDIDVKTGKLRENADSQKNIRNELNRINSSIQTSRRKLRSCLSSSASGKIDKSLDVACKSLQNITNWIGNMADGLDTAAGLYEAAEQDISGNKPSGEAVKEAEGTGKEGTGVKWAKVLFDILKSVFGLGALVSSAAILIDVLKTLVEKLGNVILKSPGSSLDALWKNEMLDNAAVGKSQPAEAVEKKPAGEGSSSVQSNSEKTAGRTGNTGTSSSGSTSLGGKPIPDSGGMPQADGAATDWDSLVGKTVADIDSACYTTDNISYKGGYKGQCTWYAYGRFYEMTGIKLGTARHAQYWLSDNASNSQVAVAYDASAIKPKSIAVRTSGKFGHVMFIENVTYSNGLPEYVYFTECNADGNGVYNPGSDCVVKKLSYSDFVAQKRPAGYISAK